MSCWRFLLKVFALLVLCTHCGRAGALDQQRAHNRLKAKPAIQVPLSYASSVLGRKDLVNDTHVPSTSPPRVHILPVMLHELKLENVSKRPPSNAHQHSRRLTAPTASSVERSPPLKPHLPTAFTSRAFPQTLGQLTNNGPMCRARTNTTLAGLYKRSILDALLIY
jgi:hypothetical protein